MRRSFVVIFCSLICACGCSAGRSHREGETSRSLSVDRTEKMREVQQRRCFRDQICKRYGNDERFFLTCEDEEFPFSERQSLPYGGIHALVHFPPLRSNSSCSLYCPSTGCPLQPELFIEFRTDEGGNPVPVEVLEEMGNDVDMSGTFAVLLYANPGYCSDWYLLFENPFCVLHTTFTYKPITVSDSSGRTLAIHKLEPGGNCLEIFVRGFRPKQRLQMTSCSAGEIMSKTIDTDENGSYSCVMFPQVVGITKGKDHITISYDEGALEASADWNQATLDIKRKQPRSAIYRMICEQMHQSDKQKLAAR